MTRTISPWPRRSRRCTETSSIPAIPTFRKSLAQTLDDDWLEVIGTQGIVVITRDQRIRYRPVEKRMWVEHRVRGFVLTGSTSQSTADSLALLGHHWMRMAAIVEARLTGPWMYAVTRAGAREIMLADT